MSDVLAIWRPRQRVKDRRGREASERPAFAVHDPDTALPTAIRDEGDLPSVG